LLFLLLLLAVHAPAQGPVSAAEVAAKVDHHYNSLRSLRVDFIESYAGMGMHRSESGTMLLKKPGKMRWSYSAPAGKVFVLDGKYAWFYTPGAAQVQRLPASQLDDFRSPLRFLLGHAEIGKELNGLTIAPEGGGYRLKGIPKGMEQRVALLALSVTEDGAIRSITIDEVSGASTSFAFSHAEENVPVTTADFAFTVPAGVAVVDGLPPI